MTHDEMLKRTGLTEHEFKHMLTAFRAFYGSLNAKEKAVVNRALPTLEQALKALGGDMDVDDFQVLLSSGGGTSGAFGQDGINQITNGGSGKGNDNPPNS